MKLKNDVTDWYFAAGENKKDLSTCGKNLDWIVDKALYALFGVQA